MNLAYVDSGGGSTLIAVVSALGTLVFIAMIVWATVQVTRHLSARREPPA